MTDDQQKPDQPPLPPKDAPAPWERRPTGDEGGELRHTLQGGDDVEYTADESQQAGYLADDQQSLDSRLKGGGRDLSAEAGSEHARLCPSCGAVTNFVQGKCSNCGHKLGAQPMPPPEAGVPAYGLPAAGSGSPLVRNILIVVIVVVVLAAIVYFFVTSQGGGTDESEAELAIAGSPGVSTSAGHAGGLNAVTIDDYFHDDARLALEAGNQAWADAGVDCYVYRYSVFEHTEPAQSQSVRITAFLGGEDAAASIEPPADGPFRTATAAFIDKLTGRAGVDASIFLMATDGEEAPAPSDVYIRYGYYYGLEHFDEIEPIILALKSIKNSEGQYPLSLSESIVRPVIRTNGGLSFMSNGYGYVPVFKTDSAGKIIMGQGSGISAFKPDACTGYYLFRYTTTESMGLDRYGLDAIIYYREKISPFPYQPKSPITNVELEPDGKPDGIACIVKDGELVRD
jgi:hypothetical protein